MEILFLNKRLFSVLLVEDVLNYVSCSFFERRVAATMTRFALLLNSERR
ncbi:unnamed protein product [Amoebophrya sp. A25]|nr:unnamed protein product [Amoebophrya sp. A25]|eukprot:GSA25T00023606001.1